MTVVGPWVLGVVVEGRTKSGRLRISALGALLFHPGEILPSAG